jgi:hypothetical protein
MGIKWLKYRSTPKYWFPHIYSASMALQGWIKSDFLFLFSVLKNLFSHLWSNIMVQSIVIATPALPKEHLRILLKQV